MSTFVDIRAALTTRLQSLSGLPPVAWENVPFERTNGVAYIQPFVLLSEPSQAEIGAAGANRHVGIYQVSVFSPVGGGIGNALQLVDAICAHFKRGTVMPSNGIAVTATKAWFSPVITEPDWLHIPVSIRFNALISN